jgi:signal transduction histidine kinase
VRELGGDLTIHSTEGGVRLEINVPRQQTDRAHV